MTSYLPPDLSYLVKTDIDVIDANGLATISFTPSVGQHWLPTLVHVGTRSGRSPNLFPTFAGFGASDVFCALYAGGPPNTTDPTKLKDVTVTGYNDTSTILSGTIVVPGEAIVCAFNGGTPGDVAFAEVYGLSSVSPPTLGIIPEVPGVRFTGAISSYANTYLYVGGASNISGPTTSPAIYTADIPYLGMNIVCNTGNARVSCAWYADQNHALALAFDTFDVRAGSSWNQTISVKAPYLIVSVVPNGSPASTSVNIIRSKTPWTSVPLNGAPPSGDNVIFATDNAFAGPGTTITYTPSSGLWYKGHALLNVWCNDTPAATNWFVNLSSLDANGAVTPLILMPTLSVGSPDTREVYLPNTPLTLTITNHDAGNKHFGVSLTSRPIGPGQ